MDAIRAHKTTEFYQIAKDAEEYDRRRNVTILQYQKILYTLSGNIVPDNYSANHKIISNYFGRFITQEVQYLIGNGVTLDPAVKERLGGVRLDNAIQRLARSARVQGCAFALWNLDHIEVFKLTEFVPLYDEETGALRAGIRYYRVAESKPLCVTLYEEDGFTEYICRTSEKMELRKEKTAYIVNFRMSEAEGVEFLEGENYSRFPILPLWGNPHHQSELVGLRTGIDAYDLIKSGFANDLDDVSQIYWIIKNAGGMTDLELAEFVERFRKVGAAAMDGDGESTITPHTVEIPYESRCAYLAELDAGLYRDAQALDVTKLSAAAKTAVEIRAAYQPLDNKCDEFEYCLLDFFAELFGLLGIQDTPSFTRSRIVNTTEDMQLLLAAAPYLDEEYITHRACALLGDPDAAEEILQRKVAEGIARLIPPGGGDGD